MNALRQQAGFFRRRWWAAGVFEEGNRRRKNKADRINGFDFNLVELLKGKSFVRTGWQEPKKWRQVESCWMALFILFYFKLLTPLADSLLERDCSKEPLLDESMINPQQLRLSLTHEAPFGVTNARARTCMRTRAHSQLVRIRTGF